MTRPHPAPLFRSFWIAGFEGATHVNGRGERLDMLAATQHDRQAAEDYALVRGLGFLTVRDAVRWHLIEGGGRYRFASLLPMLRAARRAGVQVIWTLCHYGWPDGLDLFAPAFADRFARFARAAAGTIAAESDGPPLITPINEISFFSWAAGEVGWFYPYGRGRGLELKRQLVRAALAAIEAVRDAAPEARIVQVDPLIHVIPPRGRPDLAAAAAAQRESQFEAWDMLAGRVEPALGGAERYLDVMGANFYHSNEWEYPDARLRWEDVPRDERWVPLHRLLGELYERYRRPLFVGETSHFGAGRARWILEIASEVAEARRAGVPVEGLCVFPILDRYDWEDPEHWHNSGLWDLRRNGTGKLRRILNLEYAQAVRSSQSALACGPPAAAETSRAGSP